VSRTDLAAERLFDRHPSNPGPARTPVAGGPDDRIDLWVYPRHAFGCLFSHFPRRDSACAYFGSKPGRVVTCPFIPGHHGHGGPSRLVERILPAQARLGRVEVTVNLAHLAFPLDTVRLRIGGEEVHVMHQTVLLSAPRARAARNVHLPPTAGMLPSLAGALKAKVIAWGHDPARRTAITFSWALSYQPRTSRPHRAT
jgi:hypothetical protein